MVDDLLIRVDAQVAEFNAAFGSATKSTIQLEAALKRASAQQALYQQQITKYGAESSQAQSALARAQMSNARLAEQQAAIQAKAAAEQRAALQAQATAYSRVGRTYATVGAGIVLALGASAKAAIDWEQAFTRVRQALDGSPEQIAQVESGLRDLATTLPVTHDQLALIARDASQLGVATPNIVGFTKVVGELSTTAPDLQDGATALARFLNVTGTAQDKVENVASTLTKLGQAGASTVSEIADLGLRLAGAGRTAGLTDGEILGLANSMTSLGLRVETAGTNFSKTLLTINTAVGAGGKSLSQFAQIAGESSAQFAADWRDNASGAVLTFLKGLERIRQDGGDVASTLADLGITSQRQVDVLNRLSQSTDLVTQSIDDGNQAFKDNTALQETFGKQAKTTASEMQVAANNVHDLGISLGEELLPALGDAAGLLTSVGSALNSIPGPAKDLAVLLGVAAAATTLFSGASLLLKARLIQAQLAMETAGVSTAGYSKKAIAARTGVLALGIAVSQLGSQLAGTNDTANAFVDALSSGLIAGGVTGNPLIGLATGVATALIEGAKGASEFDKQLAQLSGTMTGVVGTLEKMTGATTDSTVAWIQHQFATDDVFTAAQKLGIGLDDVTQAALGNEAALKRVNAAIAAAPDPARTLFGGIVTAAIGGTTDAIDKNHDALIQQYQAQADAAGVTRSAASIQGDFAGQVGGSSDALHQQKKAADDAKQALASYNSELARFLGKQIGVAQAIIDANKAAKEQKDGFDRSTQAGIDNTNVLLNLASSLENVDSTTKSGAKSFDDIATAMVGFQVQQGRSTKAAIEHTAALLGVDAAAIDIKKNGDVTVRVKADTADAHSKLSAVQALVQGLDGATANITVRAIIATAQSQAAAFAARGGNWTGGYTGDGGKFEPAGVVHRGEFVFDKASTSRIGPDRLMAQMRAARGYASGGPVGYADGGRVGGSLTARDILRLIAEPEATLHRVNVLLAARNEQEERLAEAQRALQRVRRDDSSTDRDLAQAEKALSSARDDARAATDKYKASVDALGQVLQSRIDQITSAADPFGGVGTSNTAQGLLAKERFVASSAREIEADLRIIRHKGADPDLIASLRGGGLDALTLLRDLIRQPKSYFKAEALAHQHVEGSARSLATFGIPGAGGQHIQTQIQRQANVIVNGGIHVADRRGYERATRRAAERALAMT